MVYLNGNYDYETLVEYAIDAYINKFYSDLEEVNALSKIHLYEAKTDIIKAVLSAGIDWEAKRRGDTHIRTGLV